MLTYKELKVKNTIQIICIILSLIALVVMIANQESNLTVCILWLILMLKNIEPHLN